MPFQHLLLHTSSSTLGEKWTPIKGSNEEATAHRGTEQAVVDWAIHMGEIGQPFSQQALHAKVADLSNILWEKREKTGILHLPSRFWVYTFLDQHPEMSLNCPVRLDAVCT
jgi:hypothetical protein